MIYMHMLYHALIFHMHLVSYFFLWSSLTLYAVLYFVTAVGMQSRELVWRIYISRCHSLSWYRYIVPSIALLHCKTLLIIVCIVHCRTNIVCSPLLCELHCCMPRSPSSNAFLPIIKYLPRHHQVPSSPPSKCLHNHRQIISSPLWRISFPTIIVCVSNVNCTFISFFFKCIARQRLLYSSASIYCVM